MTRLDEIKHRLFDLETLGELRASLAWSYVLEAYGLGRDGEPGPSEMEIETTEQP